MDDNLAALRDKNLYRAYGHGLRRGRGFSSPSAELGSDTGVRADLEKAPLKYSGLAPWEIWISESQERMVLAVPPTQWAELKALADSEGVEATIIGEFTADKKLTVCYAGAVVGQLDMTFLHDGMPRLHQKAVWRIKSRPANAKAVRKAFGRGALDYGLILRKLLAHPNIASKKWIVPKRKILTTKMLQGGRHCEAVRRGSRRSGPS